MAPRFGFAWDPFGRSRTAIRGGGGVFYDRVMTNQVRKLQINPPAVYTPSVYYGTLADLAQTSGQGILAPSANMTALSGRQHIPVTYNYSLGVQQQIGATMIVDISYVGSMARHLSWTRNINPVPIGSTQLELSPWNRDPTTTSALAAIFLHPYLGLGDITQYEFAGTSNYNSFQLSFNRRLNAGVMFGLSYTFSKTLGTADSDTSVVSPFSARVSATTACWVTTARTCSPCGTPGSCPSPARDSATARWAWRPTAGKSRAPPA